MLSDKSLENIVTSSIRWMDSVARLISLRIFVSEIYVAPISFKESGTRMGD